jgi:NAD(P)-dependent dehydrogenase (short-subunit alcohol dehydrogenase family)
MKITFDYGKDIPGLMNGLQTPDSGLLSVHSRPNSFYMKTAIVTGASGNLGQAVIKKFLVEGYHVIGSIVHSGEVTLNDTNYENLVADLMNEESAQQFVSSVITKQGRIDAAILTVGGFAMGKIADTTTAAMVQQYKLNFETAYNVARPVFMQMMKQGKGRIFMIGSRPGSDMRNSKGMIAYGMAKSLIFRLAEIMNEEAKGHDIVTSVVVPSTIDTPQNRQSMPDADFNKWVSPHAIAGIIHFYCTDTSVAIREPIIKIYNNS